LRLLQIINIKVITYPQLDYNRTKKFILQIYNKYETLRAFIRKFIAQTELANVHREFLISDAISWRQSDYGHFQA